MSPEKATGKSTESTTEKARRQSAKSTSALDEKSEGFTKAVS